MFTSAVFTFVVFTSVVFTSVEMGAVVAMSTTNGSNDVLTGTFALVSVVNNDCVVKIGTPVTGSAVGIGVGAALDNIVGTVFLDRILVRSGTAGVGLVFTDCTVGGGVLNPPPVFAVDK